MENGIIHYRRLFPWLHIFRCLRIAADPRKLFLASFAYLLILAGNGLFLNLPFAPAETGNGNHQASLIDTTTGHVANADSFSVLIDRIQYPETSDSGNYPLYLFATICRSSRFPLRPFYSMFAPITHLFQFTNGISETVFALTQILWALAVWSIFGGAICRMTALRFARDERMSVRDALKFSVSRFLSLFSAPLLPAVGILLLWLILFVAGLVGQIPVAGSFIIAIVYGLIMLIAFGIGVILLGMMCGWPLMQATIGVEDSDAFDGFSRSFSYVFSKPWHYLWYVTVAILFGVVSIAIVSWIATSVGDLAIWGLASGMTEAEVTGLLKNSQSFLHGNPALAEIDVQDTSTVDPKQIPLASWIAIAWHYAAGLLVNCFRDSYFWVSATVIYFLLRRAEDATELDEIELPATDEQEDFLPLVGMAAAEHRAGNE